MAENELKALACGTPAHGDMDHFMGSPSGSMWICKRCGLLAVHLQTTGDIWWYTASSRRRTPVRSPQDRAASGPRYPEDLTSAETGAGSTDDF